MRTAYANLLRGGSRADEGVRPSSALGVEPPSEPVLDPKRRYAGEVPLVVGDQSDAEGESMCGDQRVESGDRRTAVFEPRRELAERAGTFFIERRDRDVLEECGNHPVQLLRLPPFHSAT